MWQKIKGLREDRAQIKADMKGIIKKAEDEKRDLTADESKRFNEFLSKFELKSDQIGRLDVLNGIEHDEMREVIKGHDIGASAADDRAEVRALRKDEKAVDFVRSRINHGQDIRISFGDYIRALVAGAKNDQERAALAEGGSTTGGVTVPTILSAELIDNLRPKAIVLNAGARVVPLLSAQHNFARVTSDPVPTWRAEAGAVGESEPTFDSVQFQPKSVAFLVKCSRELFEDTVNSGVAITDTFGKVMALAIDFAALAGTGSSNQPTGIANISGVH